MDAQLCIKLHHVAKRKLYIVFLFTHYQVLLNFCFCKKSMKNLPVDGSVKKRGRSLDLAQEWHRFSTICVSYVISHNLRSNPEI